MSIKIGRSLSTPQRGRALVLVFQVPSDTVRTIVQDLQASSIASRPGASRLEESRAIGGRGVEAATKVRHCRGRVLSGVSRYRAQPARRQHGRRAVRGHVARNVRHSRLHGIHARQSGSQLRSTSNKSILLFLLLDC